MAICQVHIAIAYLYNPLPIQLRGDFIYAISRSRFH